ncbi:MAG: hypothetical protein ACQERN_02570, partial [Thermodesulfobacteriota bacterium]
LHLNCIATLYVLLLLLARPAFQAPLFSFQRSKASSVEDDFSSRITYNCNKKNGSVKTFPQKISHRHELNPFRHEKNKK